MPTLDTATVSALATAVAALLEPKMREAVAQNISVRVEGIRATLGQEFTIAVDGVQRGLEELRAAQRAHESTTAARTEEAHREILASVSRTIEHQLSGVVAISAAVKALQDQATEFATAGRLAAEIESVKLQVDGAVTAFRELAAEMQKSTPKSVRFTHEGNLTPEAREAFILAEKEFFAKPLQVVSVILQEQLDALSSTVRETQERSASAHQTMESVKARIEEVAKTIPSVPDFTTQLTALETKLRTDLDAVMERTAGEIKLEASGVCGEVSAQTRETINNAHVSFDEMLRSVKTALDVAKGYSDAAKSALEEMGAVRATVEKDIAAAIPALVATTESTVDRLIKEASARMEERETALDQRIAGVQLSFDQFNVEFEARQRAFTSQFNEDLDAKLQKFSDDVTDKAQNTVKVAVDAGIEVLNEEAGATVVRVQSLIESIPKAQDIEKQIDWHASKAVLRDLAQHAVSVAAELRTQLAEELRAITPTAEDIDKLAAASAENAVSSVFEKVKEDLILEATASIESTADTAGANLLKTVSEQLSTAATLHAAAFRTGVEEVLSSAKTTINGETATAADLLRSIASSAQTVQTEVAALCADAAAQAQAAAQASAGATGAADRAETAVVAASGAAERALAATVPALRAELLESLDQTANVERLVDNTVQTAVITAVDAAIDELEKRQKTEIIDRIRTEVDRIPKPKDGKDGKIKMPTLYEHGKVYDAESWVIHNNGVWVAWRSTDTEPHADSAEWDCISPGVVGIEAVLASDGRTINLHCEFTNGVTKASSVKLPIPVVRGVYSKETQYDHHDVVTYDNSWWEAQKSGELPPPGTDRESWKLTVRHGRDGKDAKSAAPLPVKYLGEWVAGVEVPVNGIVDHAGVRWLAMKSTRERPPYFNLTSNETWTKLGS